MGKKKKAAKRERKAFREIAKSMPDLGGIEPVSFTGGWPEGNDGVRLAMATLAHWAETLEREDGWDSTPSITLVARPDVSAADAIASGLDPDATGEPTDPMTGVLSMSMYKTVLESDPTFYLWGHDAEPEASAMIVAEEAWKGDPDSPIRPSEQEGRREIRKLEIVTRSGVAIFGEFFRDGGEPEFIDSIPTGNMLLMHRCLGVPMPEEWPRLALRDYLAMFAAERASIGQGHLLEAMGLEETTSRSAVSMALMALASSVRAITEEGRSLSGKDGSKVRRLPQTKEAWVEVEDYSEQVIPILRDVIKKLRWVDYARSPMMRATLTKDSVMWGFEPPDWGGEDVLEVWAGLGVGHYPSPAELMRDLPEDQREAVLEVLDQLGLL